MSTPPLTHLIVGCGRWSLLLPQIADAAGRIGIFPHLLVSLRGDHPPFVQVRENGLGRVLRVTPASE